MLFKEPVKKTTTRKARRFPEDDLQIAVAFYLNYKNATWFHVPNERKTTNQAGYRLKQKGVKAGVPDVMVLDKRKGFSGLAIELKVKPNKVSTEQTAWLEKLNAIGYKTAICWTFDEAMVLIDWYYKKDA